MMEGAAQRRSPWKRRGPVGSLLLLMCMFGSAVTLFQESEPSNWTCPVGDYPNKDGICCNKCSAGFKLVEECHAAGQRSTCIACPNGQYNDEMNYAPNCNRCRQCSKVRRAVEVSPCQRYRNAVCECEAGYYKYSIDSYTFECRKCRQCGADEQEKKQCTKDSNTDCVCKASYYRVGKKCELCKSCSAGCEHLCPVKTKAPERPSDTFVGVIAGAVSVFLVMLGLVAFITYKFTKRSTKKKLLSTQTSSSSQDSCTSVLIFNEPPENTSVEASPPSPTSVQDPSNLPDCVPVEIKIPELIYTVLDLVPVRQMKQLVRSLDVQETEIEQAEADHRSCQEAHYQMLRVWAERCSCTGGGGRGGRGGTLHRPLLQELLDKLRTMNLGWAVQELETKYGVQ